MVFSTAAVGRVAAASADLCQRIACNPERLSGDQVLDLLCCLPLRHLRRLSLCLFSFFCFPIGGDQRNYVRSASSSSSSSSSPPSSSGEEDSYDYDRTPIDRIRRCTASYSYT